MASADLQETETETPIPGGRTFLRRVRIRGYKSIAFCDVTLEPLTVLVGRNGCGKSNFLDALAFLRDAVKYDVREAVQRHGGWSGVACRSQPQNCVDIEVEADLKVAVESNRNGIGSSELSSTPPEVLSGTYRIRIATDDDSVPRVQLETYSVTDSDSKIHEMIHRDYSRGKYVVDAPGNLWAPIHKSASHDGSALLKLASRPEKCAIGVYSALLFANFTTPLETMVVLNPEPSLIRQQQLPTGGGYLLHHAANLPAIVRQFARSSPEWYERAKRYVKYIVPDVSDLDQISYGEYETLRFWMNYAVNGKKVEFDARSMSDGTLRAVACIIGAFQNIPPYGRPSLVGIEEPETSLHPGAMNGLVDALDEATLATQIIITTHSAELLDNPTIQPHNVRAVEMVDGRTIIGPLDQASFEIIQRNLDTLGGLERQNQLEVDLDDRDRQQALANG